MNDTNATYTIGEVSSALGVSIAAIRSLCNAGLVPQVRRSSTGRRLFQDWQLNHIRILLGLRQAGLSNAELRRYTRLVRQGRRSLPARKALMETRKRQLWQQLEDVQQGIDFLERQVEIIDRELRPKPQY